MLDGAALRPFSIQGTFGRTQECRCFLHGPSGASDQLFVDRKLVPTRIDAVSQAPHGKIGKILADLIEATTELFDVWGHLRSVTPPCDDHKDRAVIAALRVLRSGATARSNRALATRRDIISPIPSPGECKG